MSTVAEIEQAIAKLPASDRDAIESRLLARRCGLGSLTKEEQADLLASLDEAEHAIDGGLGISGAELRAALHEWTGK